MPPQDFTTVAKLESSTGMNFGSPNPGASTAWGTNKYPQWNVKASATYETQVLEKAMGGSGSIAFLTGLLTDGNTALREQGVNQAITASGGKVKLAQLVSNIDSASAAPPAVESLLASKGSTLNGMLSTDYYP